MEGMREIVEKFIIRQKTCEELAKAYKESIIIYNVFVSTCINQTMHIARKEIVSKNYKRMNSALKLLDDCIKEYGGKQNEKSNHV